MMNNTTLMGRLVRDPDLRRTQSGTAVVSFTLAVERDFKTQDGARDTDFIDCVAWRNTAEFIAKHFTKGRMMAVTGAIQTRNYQAKDGGNRKAVEVVVDHAYFADSRTDGGGSSSAAPNDLAGFEEMMQSGYDSDLPF